MELGTKGVRELEYSRLQWVPSDIKPFKDFNVETQIVKSGYKVELPI